jgi:DNA-binding response OmpR family regulator
MQILIVHDDRAAAAVMYATLRREFFPASIHLVSDARALNRTRLEVTDLAIVDSTITWREPEAVAEQIAAAAPRAGMIALYPADSDDGARVPGITAGVDKGAARLNAPWLLAMRDAARSMLRADA